MASANYTPNGFSDGLFTGRVIAQNYDGSGNALRVDLSNNALYVQDMRNNYENGRLLTTGPSQLQDGSGRYFTSTVYNYSGTDFSKNYVQLDVFDSCGNYYLKQIAEKPFNLSGSIFVIDKVKITDGSGFFYTSVRNPEYDISYNQLAVYDYSANKTLENILGNIRSFTTTKRIFDPTKNSYPSSYNISGYSVAGTEGYNSFSRYIDLRNKSVTSLSFYGTVSQSCILVVQYANPISNVDANAIPVGQNPTADGPKYGNNGLVDSPKTTFGSITLSNYDLSGWYNTQYNTKITVASTGTPTAFGFNVPFCNAQFVRLMIYKTDGSNPGTHASTNDFTWPRPNDYTIGRSLEADRYVFDPDIYVSFTYTLASYLT
jgi:hypothetical protein